MAKPKSTDIKLERYKMKPIRRTIMMRNEAAFYRNRFVGTTTRTLYKAFNLPYNGRIRVIIKEGGPYKIVGYGGFFDISINGEKSGNICKTSFCELFFKPDGRKRYSIQVKILDRG